MNSGCRLSQLDSDPQPITGPSHAAVDKIAHIKRTAGFLG